MSRQGCAAARLTLLQKQHRREAVDAPPPAAKRKTSTALGRPAPGKGPVRRAVPLELGPAVVCLGQQQDHRAHLGGPQAGWVRLGLFLSGQKRSPPGLSRTSQRRPRSPPTEGPLRRAQQEARRSGRGSAGQRALCSPLTRGETLPKGESGPSDHVAGAPSLGSPEPNPTAQPETGGPARLAPDPAPIRPGWAASCRGSGCPWGPGGS